MELDLDTILDAALPWDFTVRLDGKAYKTRRPSLGELAAFDRAKTQPTHLVPLIGSLFDGASPPPTAWTVDRAVAFVAGYVEYFNRANAGRKPPADVAAAATAAVAAGLGDPGTSS